MTTRLAPPPVAAPAWHVELTPPAVAMVWLGHGRRHEAVAVPGVALAEGEVLVAIELATVCGSDVRTVAGHRTVPTPLVLGHEFVGRVAAISGTVRTVDGSRLREGERVIWSTTAACLVCDRCRRGIPQKCRELRTYGRERLAPRWELTGGFASHAHLRPGTAIVRVDEATPAEVLAPATCGTATAWAAVDRADRVVDVDGAVVLVTGAGLVGLTVSAIATDRGARVIVSDPDPARRALALRFGAAAVVDPGDPARPDDLARAVAAVGGTEIDIVIEASGSSAAVETALCEVGIGGVVVLVGTVSPSAKIAFDPEQAVRTLLTVRGVSDYSPDDLAAAAGYLHARHTAYPFAQLVGERMPLAEVDAALAAAGPGGPVRVALAPGL